jgi:predicted O-methyltransferase YrrM
MYSSFQLSLHYLHYYFTASSGKGHGIHSPFVFSFIESVLNDTRYFYAYDRIELLREALLSDGRLLEIVDMGAGSVAGSNTHRKVKEIAARAAKPRKLAQLLFRIANYYQPMVMVELGTSLGISAAYLASGNLKGALTTLEGASQIVGVAHENIERLQLNNVNIVEGHFDKTLPHVLSGIDVVNLAFIDGNHQKKATLQYFHQLLEKKNEETILIFDDIYWSKDMEEAWSEIKHHPEVLLTIDLFFIGLVFFRHDFKTKQHFRIRF